MPFIFIKRGFSKRNYNTMSIYIIQGGHKLKGSISVNSSKNTGVGLLCAALLNEGITELFNFPNLEETKRMIEVLESIGVKITWPHPRQLRIEPPKKINWESINYKAASATRSVLMLLGALIHKLDHFNLPKSGGCKLGSRTVAPHLYALEKFGVKGVFWQKMRSDFGASFGAGAFGRHYGQD